MHRPRPQKRWPPALRLHRAAPSSSSTSPPRAAPRSARWRSRSRARACRPAARIATSSARTRGTGGSIAPRRRARRLRSRAGRRTSRVARASAATSAAQPLVRRVGDAAGARALPGVCVRRRRARPGGARCRAAARAHVGDAQPPAARDDGTASRLQRVGDDVADGHGRRRQLLDAAAARPSAFFLPLRGINASHALAASRVLARFAAVVPLEDLGGAGARLLQRRLAGEGARGGRTRTAARPAAPTAAVGGERRGGGGGKGGGGKGGGGRRRLEQRQALGARSLQTLRELNRFDIGCTSRRARELLAAPARPSTATAVRRRPPSGHRVRELGCVEVGSSRVGSRYVMHASTLAAARGSGDRGGRAAAASQPAISARRFFFARHRWPPALRQRHRAAPSTSSEVVSSSRGELAQTPGAVAAVRARKDVLRHAAPRFTLQSRAPVGLAAALHRAERARRLLSVPAAVQAGLRGSQRATSAGATSRSSRRQTARGAGACPEGSAYVAKCATRWRGCSPARDRESATPPPASRRA